MMLLKLVLITKNCQRNQNKKDEIDETCRNACKIFVYKPLLALPVHREEVALYWISETQIVKIWPYLEQKLLIGHVSNDGSLIFMETGSFMTSWKITVGRLIGLLCKYHMAW